MEEGRDPVPLARTVVSALIVWLVVQTAEAAAALLQIHALTPLDPATPLSWSDSIGGPTVDLIVGVTALAWLIVYAATAFLVLKWIYRVNRNAQLQADGLSVSPGWNVGSFFVPIVTLWKPFQGVRESWQVSHGSGDWRDVPVPALLRWWWACWLASSTIGYASMRLSFGAATAGDTLASLWLDVIDGVIGIPLGLLLIRIVRQLSAAQARMLHASTFA